MANSHNILGQTAIFNHIHSRTPRGWGAEGTPSVHPPAPAGFAQPRHMPAASPAALHGAKPRIGFLSAARWPTLQLLKGFSFFTLEREEGRLKDTSACPVYSREKGRKPHLKTTG